MAAPTLDDWKQMYHALWRIRCSKARCSGSPPPARFPAFRTCRPGRKRLPSASARISRARTCCSPAIVATATCSPRAATSRRPSPRFSAGEDGLCRGRGGSMHLVDAANGVLGATGVVGGNLALAAGAAWAAQAQGKQQHQRGVLRRRRDGRRRVPRDAQPRRAVAAAGAVRLREQRLRRVHQPRGALQRHAGQQLRRALCHRHEDHRRQRSAGRACGRGRGDRSACAGARARICSSA